MARLALVTFILPVLDGSSEEGFAGVAADAAVVKVGNGLIPAHVTVGDRPLLIDLLLRLWRFVLLHQFVVGSIRHNVRLD